MSEKYDEYLDEHKANVSKAFAWLKENITDLPLNEYPGIEWQINFNHDLSKSDKEEYDAYDAYFYGHNRSYSVVQDFNKAWLHHIHRNEHHWQHWVLINDDPKEGEILLDMPFNYIIEMVCDWWSFSWASGDLYSIFKWYEQHREYMKLSEHTRTMVEKILDLIKQKLEEE